MLPTVSSPNSPSNPTLLAKVPICQQEGCAGHCVAVYHRINKYRYSAQGCGPIVGLRLYSGLCWKHQKWDVFKATKFDMYASGQIPLHSKLVIEDLN